MVYSRLRTTGVLHPFELLNEMGDVILVDDSVSHEHSAKAGPVIVVYVHGVHFVRLHELLEGVVVVFADELDLTVRGQA